MLTWLETYESSFRLDDLYVEGARLVASNMSIDELGLELRRLHEIITKKIQEYPDTLPENAKIVWDYIGTLSYPYKYWTILRTSLEDGTFDKLDLSTVYSEELEEEFVRAHRTSVEQTLVFYLRGLEVNHNQAIQILTGMSGLWSVEEFLTKTKSEIADLLQLEPDMRELLGTT